MKDKRNSINWEVKVQPLRNTSKGNKGLESSLDTTPRNTVIVDDTVDVCRANPNNSIQCSRFLAVIGLVAGLILGKYLQKL